ncbi:MAG TPA: hypothetical protein VN798_17630, partial [Pseudomonas sp.]|nr:hypothetical protein [Pseudomonas sp.]
MILAQKQGAPTDTILLLVERRGKSVRLGFDSGQKGGAWPRSRHLWPAFDSGRRPWELGLPTICPEPAVDS